MATTSKLSFRARNLDASKSMPVYIVDELPDLAECTPINRAVAQMPTGMEKDEEMESHLQEAIIAQQASTSGINVENHVIPTPKVVLVDASYYDSIYPVQPPPSRNQLIKVQASLTIDREQAEYDIDSGDEQWLQDRGGPSADDFERMMELLEGASSDLQICQPREARSLLKDFDDNLIDDVYDYWLQKRKDAAAERNVASLIPRVKTDTRRDAPGSVNPYVAFRRRAEKIQTRRNRKNDEDSYEKMIKLGYDLSKAVILFEMMLKREQAKLELVGLDESLFDSRWSVGDWGSHYYNQLHSKVKSESRQTLCADDAKDDLISGSMASLKTKGNGHKRKKHIRNTTANANKDVLTRQWMKKIAETWNKPPQPFSSLSGMCSQRASSLADAERNAAAAEAAADGRYAFKRRRGCVYRDVLPVGDASMAEELEARLRGYSPSLLRVTGHNTQQHAMSQDPSLRFYNTFLPSSSNKGVRRCIGYARRRVGRGGRIVFDRFMSSPPSTSQCAPDDRPHPYIDLSRRYEGRTTEVDSDSDDWSVDSEDERLTKEQEEEHYARRDHLFRMRIFDGVSQSVTQRLQTGTLPDACDYASERQWPDSGGSSSSPRSQPSDRDHNFRPSAPLKDSGGGGSSATMNGFHPNSLATSRCDSVAVNEGKGRAGSTSRTTPSLKGPAAVGVTNGGPTSATPTPSNGVLYVPTKSAAPFTVPQRQEKRASSAEQEQRPQAKESQIFYPHLPPSETSPMVVGQEEAGGQHHHSTETAPRRGTPSFSPPFRQTAKRMNNGTDRRLYMSSVITDNSATANGDSPQMRVNGVKRAKGSSPSSKGYLEANLKRVGSSLVKLGAEGAVGVVDTKRLELAIAGSGARIKVPPLNASLCASVAGNGLSEVLGAPLIEALKASPGKALCYPTSRPFHQTALAKPASLSPTSIANNCYLSSDKMVVGIASSPDSESMSPPMPTSPAVVPDLGRHLGMADTKLPTPVAVVSGSVNGLNSSAQMAS